MKTLLLYLFALALAPSALANPQHGQPPQEPNTSEHSDTTISIRESDQTLCHTPLWINFYEVTVAAYAHGGGTVEVSEYEKQVFAWVRSSEEFSDGGAEAFVDHIKDIPGQLVKIIAEDPAVLESCANFSVALIGPP